MDVALRLAGNAFLQKASDPSIASTPRQLQRTQPRLLRQHLLRRTRAQPQGQQQQTIVCGSVTQPTQLRPSWKQQRLPQGLPHRF